jgi:hypothetical protein
MQMEAGELSLVVFVQNQPNGDVLQAVKISLRAGKQAQSCIVVCEHRNACERIAPQIDTILGCDPTVHGHIRPQSLQNRASGDARRGKKIQSDITIAWLRRTAVA